MGTRSLTRVIPQREGLSFKDGHLHPEKSVVNMYRQFDGYPEGHGQDLAAFLSNLEVVNGLSSESSYTVANGPGCLAALLVAYFKDGPGSIYLEQCNGEPGVSCEEYIYTVYPKEGEQTIISVYKVYEEEVIFVGTPEELVDQFEEAGYD